MTDTELDRLDTQIALGRKQVLSATACGDTFDAEIYEHHVDELLDERNRLVRGPLTLDPGALPTITTGPT